MSLEKLGLWPYGHPTPMPKEPSPSYEKRRERDARIRGKHFTQDGAGAAVMGAKYDRLTGRMVETTNGAQRPINEKRFSGSPADGPSVRGRLKAKMIDRPDGGYQGKKAQAFKDKYTDRIRNQVKRRKQMKRDGSISSNKVVYTGPKIY